MNQSTQNVASAITLKNIEKRFGTVHANKNINLDIPAGTIHGIIGENGAGKSTLMNIIYGFYEANSGEILINGVPTRIASTQDAINAGIGMVHQHFMLVNNFTVLENIILGAEGGALLKEGVAAARKELQRLEKEYNLDVDLDAVIEDLPVGVQQRVEILKALYKGAKILILDEPTGVLTPQETDQMFRILDTLREQGVTILLITHKLREILAATNNVSVMCRGEMVAHRETAQTNKEELAELMVGRKVRLKVDKKPAEPGKPLLKMDNVSVFDEDNVERLKSVSLEVRGGEILGIAGVSGNGQTELLEVLSGISTIDKGTITICDESITPESPKNPAEVRQLGVGHIAEDRLRMAMVKSFSANETNIMGYHNNPEYNGKILQNKKAMLKDCQDKMERWDVRPPIPELKAGSFSGGNQQKIVVAREIEQDPNVLLVGQPTRGVDIGAIEFIHKRIIDMRDEGKAVVLVSVELEEVMSVADRILVMFDGHIVGEVSAAEADERTLGLMMANIVPEHLGGKQ